MNWPKKKKKKKIQKKRDKRFPVEEPTDWIHWFCKMKGNEYFVEVDEDFIKKKKIYTIYTLKKFVNFIKINNKNCLVLI